MLDYEQYSRVMNDIRKKWEKAEILFKRALEIREKLLSDTDKELVPILKNYGIMLRKTTLKKSFLSTPSS